jgi:hypothetical protein
VPGRVARPRRTAASRVSPARRPSDCARVRRVPLRLYLLLRRGGRPPVHHGARSRRRPRQRLVQGIAVALHRPHRRPSHLEPGEMSA